MSIVTKTFDVAGQIGDHPRRIKMIVTDNLTTVTTAGYLNNQSLAPDTVYTTDIFDIIYSYNTSTQVGTYGVFLPSITAGVITLIEDVSEGNVLLPVIDSHIAVFNGTTGQIKDDAATAINGGNIQAGLSGTAGYLASFPGTASKGSLRVTAVANTGNTVTTISNAAMGQASVISIPDPAGATANFAVAPAALVNNNLVKASGTNGLVADAGIAAANVMQLNAVNTMSGSGQIILVKANGVEAANAVTASGNAGVITTSALTTAGGASYAITWTNTKISATSVIALSIMGGTNTVQNITMSATAGAGTSTLTIYNNTAATPLDGTILIGYSIL